MFDFHIFQSYIKSNGFVLFLFNMFRNKSYLVPMKYRMSFNLLSIISDLNKNFDTLTLDYIRNSLLRKEKHLKCITS